MRTYDDLVKTKLPILNEFRDPGTNALIIEFDLGKRQQIKEALDHKRLLCHPLLMIIMDPTNYTKADVVYNIRQNVAAKYLNMKLIQSTNQGKSANIDQYSLTMRGISLDFN